MSALFKFLRKRKEIDYGHNKLENKLYKWITNLSITIVFAVCAILVFAFSGYIKLTPFLFGLISTLFIICIACLLILPWIRIYEKYQFKKTY